MLKIKKKKEILPTEADEAEMSFLDHLEVLRWHVIRSIGVVVTMAIVIFVFRKFVFEQIIMAPKRGDFFTYKVLCAISEALCFSPPPLDIINVGMAEQFIVSIKVSIFLGLVAAFPYIFWEIWRFVKPGLYDNEKKVTRGVVLKCSLLFLSGVCFGYYLISPYAINFLASFDLGMDMRPTATLDSYVTYMTMFTVPTGIIFELPIIVYFLSRIGIVTPTFMRKYRRHAFVLILILAATITPPDAITQFLIGVPVYVLYEISIRISAAVYREAEQDAEATKPTPV